MEEGNNIGKRFHWKYDSNIKEKNSKELEIEKERDESDEELKKMLLQYPDMSGFFEEEIDHYIKSNRKLLEFFFNAIRDSKFEDDYETRVAEMSFGYFSKKERKFLGVEKLPEEEVYKFFICNTLRGQDAIIIKNYILTIKKDQLKVKSKKELTEEKIQELADSTSDLYSRINEDFWVKEFNKLNKWVGKIFLLDKFPTAEKSLKNKIIIREMFLYSYLAWKKTFEAVDIWKENGFDYVPIERPKSVFYYHPSENKVGLETEVIKGPNVLQWLSHGGGSRKEILEQIEKIESTLKKIGVDHIHPHYGNYVLSFERDKDGKADISVPPRVYLIDFEMSF